MALIVVVSFEALAAAAAAAVEARVVTLITTVAVAGATRRSPRPLATTSGAPAEGCAPAPALSTVAARLAINTALIVRSPC